MAPVRPQSWRKMKWTHDNIAFLQENYPSLGGTECGRILSLPPTSVRRKAIALGLRVNEETRRRTQAINASRPRPDLCKIDANFFIESTTKESAYLLGILWADGSLLNSKDNPHKISLEIASKDHTQIMPTLLSAGKWTASHRTRKGRQPQSTSSTSNKVLFNFLAEHNYLTKNGSPTILDKIAEELKPYWYRGFFDGDGWFYVNTKQHLHQMGFAGPFDQDWTFITTLLKTLKVQFEIKPYTSKKGHKSSSIRSSSMEDLIKFGDYMYGDQYDGMGLIRKYNKYLQVKNRFCHRDVHGNQDESS